MGQYGLVPGILPWLPKNMTTSKVYALVYNALAQDTLSFANYWHDPFHEQGMCQSSSLISPVFASHCFCFLEFLKVVTFLPVINDMTTHPKSGNYKKNFLRLKKCVFIGGPSDEIIAPWQSAIFGFWNSDQSKISKLTIC